MMLALAVPGSSIPGPSVPDAVVLGPSLDAARELLAAGVEDIVLACSADALRHSLRAAAGQPVLLVLDAAAPEDVLLDLRRQPSLLENVTVATLNGALRKRQRELLSGARVFIEGQCAAALTVLARRIKERRSERTILLRS